MKTIRLIIATILLGLMASFSPDTAQYRTPNELSSSFEHDGYVLITNNGYRGIRVNIYYNNYSQWDYIGTLFIPGQDTKSFGIGKHDMLSDYAYTTDTEDSLVTFWSDHIQVY